MKKIKQTNLLFLAVLIGLISSCSTSNSVVTNGLFSKRKYNDGFHYNGRSIIKSGDSDQMAAVKNEKSEVLLSNLNESKNAEATKETTVVASETAIVMEENTSSRNENKTAQKNVTKTESLSKSKINSTKKNENSEKTLAERILKNKLKKIAQKENNTSGDEAILYIILCILIPFVAVGLATDWDVTKVLICLLLSFLFWIPGIIYAFIVCKKEGAI